MFRYYVLILNRKWHSNNVPKSMKYGILIYTTDICGNEMCEPLLITTNINTFQPTGIWYTDIKKIEAFTKNKLRSDEVVQHVITSCELEDEDFGKFNGDKTYKLSGVKLLDEPTGEGQLEFSFTNSTGNIVSVIWHIELARII
jgi:hypothetical protein